MICSTNNNQELETPTTKQHLHHCHNPPPEEDDEESGLLFLQNHLQKPGTLTASPSAAAATAFDSSCSSLFDDPTTTDRFSLLRLNSFPPSSTTPLPNHPPCTSCGCNGAVCLASSSSHSHKRPSPEPTSEAREPKLKKPNNGHSLEGFNKIPLPIIPNQTKPVLRRCHSDPSNSPSTTTSQMAAEPPQSPPPQSTEMVCPSTPSSTATASAAKLPPRAPIFRRSVSDPTPSPGKTISSSCGMMGENEGFNSKMLRKVSNFVTEVNRRWDEVLHDQEDGCLAEETNNDNNNENKNDAPTEEDPDRESVEAVSVERQGECLIIDFKCPCDRGYKILLSGGNCYYKLL